MPFGVSYPMALSSLAVWHCRVVRRALEVPKNWIQDLPMTSNEKKGCVTGDVVDVVGLMVAINCILLNPIETLISGAEAWPDTVLSTPSHQTTIQRPTARRQRRLCPREAQSGAHGAHRPATGNLNGSEGRTSSLKRTSYDQLALFESIDDWLVVWNMAFIFPNSWDDDPIWLIVWIIWYSRINLDQSDVNVFCIWIVALLNTACWFAVAVAQNGRSP